jgi:hypothetical protein
MPANKHVRKQYSLDAKKVKRVQRILKAKTETEALDQALQLIIDGDTIDRAHKRLVESGGEIVDTMGRLDR